MENQKKEPRGILPASGIWTVEDMARYMGISSSDVQEKLTEMGVKTLRFSIKYKHRLFRLEDLKLEKER